MPEHGADIIIEGKKIGQMRSSYGKIGLALIRDTAFDAMQNSNIRPFKPEWMNDA